MPDCAGAFESVHDIRPCGVMECATPSDMRDYGIGQTRGRARSKLIDRMCRDWLPEQFVQFGTNIQGISAVVLHQNFPALFGPDAGLCGYNEQALPLTMQGCVVLRCGNSVGHNSIPSFREANGSQATSSGPNMLSGCQFEGKGRIAGSAPCAGTVWLAT